MKCYLCDKEETSREHVPPKGFFPSNNRVNLITVPSCTMHNQDTHLDDEYVRNFIALTKGNNQVGVSHFRNKGIRSLLYSPKLSATIAKNPNQINLIKGDDTTKHLTFQVEMLRFDRVIKKISYGLYYYKFGQTWNHQLEIAKQNLVTHYSDIDPLAECINSHINLRQSISYEGNNQDVFKFSFLSSKNNPHKILAMKFYENFECWAVPRISTNKPSLEE